MARVHLVELEDLPWFPAVVRDAGTAYLHFIETKTGQPASIAPRIGSALQAAGTMRIVDLCSGGAGPVPGIVEALAANGQPVEATLTDFFPNVPALERARSESKERISIRTTPVDATNVPRDLTGLRTLFNAFHHFRPAMAQKILADAVAAEQPIAIFEVVRRSAPALLSMLFSPIAVLLLVPFLRPFRWAWVPLTYLLPVIPLFVIWDGVVSCLRIYSPDELRALVKQIPSEGWTWEIGEFAMKGGPVPATYLIGLPPRRAA